MGVFVTYDDGNRLEDVMRMVVQVSPDDTPFFSYRAKTKATNTLHQWPEDTLGDAAENAAVEGSTFTYGTVTAPVRLDNVCQIFRKSYFVSATEIAVKGAGVDNMLTYQKAKAIKEIALDIEKALLTGSRVTGNVSLARHLAGAINYVTTNATGVGSGTKMTESFYNGLCELCYTAGGDPDETYVGARLKRVISSFTAGVTKNMDSSDKRLINGLDVLENDFGVQKIYASRLIPSTTITNAACLIIEGSKFKVAILREVGDVANVAQDSSGTKGVIEGELTMEALAERHNALATGLDTSFVA